MHLRACKKILVIDDDPAAGNRVVDMLVEQGRATTVVARATSFKAASTQLAMGDIDLVLIEPCLDGSEGVDVVSRIRALASNLPIVVLTRLNTDEAAAGALKAGAQDYLIKDQIDARGLVRALNHAIERKLLQEALFAEKERAEVTLNCIGDAVICTDLNGKLTYLNPAAETLTHWSSLEALGRPIRDVFHMVRAEDHLFIPDPTEMALRLDRIVSSPSESSLVRRDGIEIAVEDTAAPIHDRQGRPVGAVMVLRDVSAARAAVSLLSSSVAEVAAQCALANRVASDLAAVVHSSPVAIYATDPEGLVTLWSPAAERISGFSRLEALGKFLPIVPERETESAKDLVRKVSGGYLRSNLQQSRIKKDGTPIELSVSVGPLVDEFGRPRGTISIAEDVTEAKTARKRLDSMQSEFVSTVSHELRTPLTSIGGSLGLIAGGAAGPVGGRVARLIAIAYENTQRLSRLVNDILDIESVQANGVAFRFVPVLLSDLVDQTITANLPYAERFGVELRSVGDPCDAVIKADPDRVAQAITNLVSNAIKFSPRDAPVEISTERTGHGARITVRDHGPGIAEDFRPRIYERFSQDVSSNQRKLGGSGLGLSIVREIMERHGGSVSFETTMGAGSAFHLQFPVLSTLIDEAPRINSISQAKPVLVYAFESCKSDRFCETLRSRGLPCAPAFSEEGAFVAASNGAAGAAIVSLPFGGDDLGAFLLSLRRYGPADDFPILLVSAEPDASGYSLDALAPSILNWAAVAKDEKAAATHSPAIPRLRSRRRAILHVDDRVEVLGALRRALGFEFRVVGVPTIERAIQSLDDSDFELVVVDVKLLTGSGAALISAVVAADAHPMLVMTSSQKETSADAHAATAPAVGFEADIDLSMLANSVRSALSRPDDRPSGIVGARYETQGALR